MQALFSSRATLLIALLLVVPEILRALSGALEPYPAVLLPAGAGKIKLKNGELPLKLTTFQAQRGGQWRSLDTATFLDPLPVHFLGGIVRADLGLHVGQWPGILVPPPTANAREVAETKRWIREKLERMSCDGHRIRVVEEELILEIPSGRRRASRVLREKTYELD